jgi:hypothetical protein
VLKPRRFTLALVLCQVRVHPKRANTSGVFPSTKWASERSLAHPLPLQRLRTLRAKLPVLPPRAQRQIRFTRPFPKYQDRLLADPRRSRSHPRLARQSRLLPHRRPYLVQTTARRIVAAR